MHFIKAEATRIFDNSGYPEIICCEFLDANGRKHCFVEKWPVVSAEKLERHFPQACAIGCTVIQRKAGSYVVSTMKPWGIESVEGTSEFEISKELMFEAADSVLTD